MKRAIVIGGGVIGITTSHKLSKLGFEVICFEKAKTLASKTSASYKNGGLICPSLSKPWANKNNFKNLFKSISSEISPIVITKNALMDINFYKFILKFLFHSVNSSNGEKRLQDLGYKSADSFRKLMKEYPELKFSSSSKGTIQLLGGVTENSWTFNGNDFNGNIYEFTNNLAKISDFKILTESEIKKFNIKNNKIISVIVNEKEYFADHFVICAGIYTPQLLKPLGIDISIYPVKGYVVSAKISKPLEYNIVDEKNKLYITCLGDSDLRISGFAIFDEFNSEIDEKYPNFLLSSAKKLLADIQFSNVSFHTCFRPMTPNDLPIIGALKYDNLWVNCGHGSKGFTQCLGSAEELSELINEYELKS